MADIAMRAKMTERGDARTRCALRSAMREALLRIRLAGSRITGFSLRYGPFERVDPYCRVPLEGRLTTSRSRGSRLATGVHGGLFERDVPLLHSARDRQYGIHIALFITRNCGL